MAYRDFKDLARTASDKILHNKVYNFAKNSKYDKGQYGSASIVYKFFDKKTSESIIRKFKKRKVNSTFICNNWGCCSC